MTWEDIIKNDRISDEHKERLRAMEGYTTKVPSFDEGADPFDELQELQYDDAELQKIFNWSIMADFMQKGRDGFAKKFNVRTYSGFMPPYDFIQEINERIIEYLYQDFREVMNEMEKLGKQQNKGE